jgi:hypothetical protein
MLFVMIFVRQGGTCDMYSVISDSHVSHEYNHVCNHVNPLSASQLVSCLYIKERTTDIQLDIITFNIIDI